MDPPGRFVSLDTNAQFFFILDHIGRFATLDADSRFVILDPNGRLVILNPGGLAIYDFGE